MGPQFVIILMQEEFNNLYPPIIGYVDGVSEVRDPGEGKPRRVIADCKEFLIVHIVVGLLAHGLVKFHREDARSVHMNLPQNRLLCFAVDVTRQGVAPLHFIDAVAKLDFL